MRAGVVAADVRLDQVLAVAGDVPGHAEARRDRGVVVHASELRDLSLEEIDPHARVQREP
jgi:hypothetical protein